MLIMIDRLCDMQNWLARRLLLVLFVCFKALCFFRYSLLAPARWWHWGGLRSQRRRAAGPHQQAELNKTQRNRGGGALQDWPDWRLREQDLPGFWPQAGGSTINKSIAALNNPVRGPKAQTYRNRWRTPSPHHPLLSGGGDRGGYVHFLRLTVVSFIICLYGAFVIIYHQNISQIVS